MSKIEKSALTEEEIEEELINNDLMHSGGVDDQSALQQMDLEEKKNLLHCIKQSKEDFHQEAVPTSRPLKKPIIIDTTPTEFPSLPATTKTNKLKLQRRQSKNDSSDSQDHCISLLDDDNDLFATKPKRFSLPGCVSDDAPPLPMPERAFRREKCPYYQIRGELREEALRRMLNDHDSWKYKYNAEKRKLESRALDENIEDPEDKEPKSEENGDDSENDPYIFRETTKTYSNCGTKKKETKKGLDKAVLQPVRTPQRRTSRDSDCEEVKPILKPDEPKLGEWLTATKPRNKRNRKQNREKAQNQPEIEFEFENRSLWGPGRSSGPQSPIPAPAPTRRSFISPSVTQPEEKVQCPICQQSFTLSTIENHAATCEGFSSSPMDVEEGP